MTPLPAALDPDAELAAWRIDAQRFAATWDSGTGAEQLGGRWNPKGVKAVYCSLDPSTCLVESAVHRGFKVLDSSPHVLTRLVVTQPSALRVVMPDEIPNPAWLAGGIPSAHQQAWGASLLAAHGLILVPSAVSRHSWNLILEPVIAREFYALVSQERLSVDTRFNPAA